METIQQIVSAKPTDLRMNDDYIFYYNNLAKLIITGVVPFAALCIFNFKVLISKLSTLFPNTVLLYFICFMSDLLRSQKTKKCHGTTCNSSASTTAK